MEPWRSLERPGVYMEKGCSEKRRSYNRLIEEVQAYRILNGSVLLTLCFPVEITEWPIAAEAFLIVFRSFWKEAITVRALQMISLIVTFVHIWGRLHAVLA
jgi:hypothetical protein